MAKNRAPFLYPAKNGGMVSDNIYSQRRKRRKNGKKSAAAFNIFNRAAAAFVLRN